MNPVPTINCIVLSVVLFFLGCLSVEADIYYYVDKHGNYHFSKTPLTNEYRLYLQTDKPSRPHPDTSPSQPTHQLTIVTIPPQTHISLIDPAMPYTPGMQLPPGVYLVQVAADGYFSKQERVQIINSDVTRTITLNRITDPLFKLTVRTIPSDATVRIIAPPMTYTADMRLKPGKYLVEVSADGYETKQDWIQIANSNIRHTVALASIAPPEYALTVQTNPADARVSIIEPAQTYTAGIKLEPGSYVVEVSAEGFITRRESIQITTSDVTSRISLSPVLTTEYKLFIKTEPEGAQIEILNIRPTFEQGMELEPGSYHIKVSAEGYKTRDEWIHIIDADVRHTVDLQTMPVPPGRAELPEAVASPDPDVLPETEAAASPDPDALPETEAVASPEPDVLPESVDPPAPSDEIEIGRDRHLILLDNGIVRDTRSGLEWYMGPDHDTTRRSAETWANRLQIGGGGWRLPDRAELETIFERGRGSRNMSSLFQTRGWYFWASDAAMAPFDFSGGSQRWHQLRPARDSRALAVRKP